MACNEVVVTRAVVFTVDGDSSGGGGCGCDCGRDGGRSGCQAGPRGPAGQVVVGIISLEGHFSHRHSGSGFRSCIHVVKCGTHTPSLRLHVAGLVTFVIGSRSPVPFG